MNIPPITLATIKQLHDGQFLETHIPVAPLRDIIGNYVEDKTERVFRLISTITLVPFRASRRPLIKIRHMNSITKGFVKKFTLVLNETDISQRQFDYAQFLGKNHLASSPKFSALIPHAGEFTINRVSELLKSDELEVELVSFLITIIDEGLGRKLTLDEILARLKAAAAPYREILELIEIAHKIHGIQFYKYEHLITHSLEIARELVKKNPKYLKLIFCMIPNHTLVYHYGSQQAYIISSLIDSCLGISTADRVSIEDSNTGLTVKKSKEVRDLDIPFSKGEIVAALLADFEQSCLKTKISLNDIIFNFFLKTSTNPPTSEQFEAKRMQFLARCSLSAPFPSNKNSQVRILADYFVEATLNRTNEVNLDQSQGENIFSEIWFLFSQGATTENAWNYIAEVYEKFGFHINRKFKEKMSDVLIRMGIPIEENALIHLLYYEPTMSEFFRPHFKKEAFDRILNAVLKQKIVALDFSIVRPTEWVSCQLIGISYLLEKGVIPSPADISELKIITNFLNKNNYLSYFKGGNYNKRAHEILREDKLVQDYVAKIKAIINKPPAIV